LLNPGSEIKGTVEFEFLLPSITVYFIGIPWK